ncbi:MAG: hypothetical protein FWF79_02665 [Defluviitaleaceae bacterium]|nr:hypothetical protein [Defluviitaleaceae bacterium]
MVIYDLQNAIEEKGFFTKRDGIKHCGNTPPLLEAIESGGKRAIKITNRVVREDGVALLLPEISGLIPGDRLTVTGRVGEGAPTVKEWGMCLRSPRGQFNQVAQAIAPKDIFILSYVLDKTDLPHPLYIHANAWGEAVPDMDFTIDTILISRPDNTNEREDSRQLVYSLETDEYMATYRSGDIFIADPDCSLAPSGSPVCIIRRHGYANAIHVGKRNNDWDGLDIRLPMLGLMPGNSYNVHIVGRIEGNAPTDAQIMLQIIPGYAWRDNHTIYSNSDFTLGHTLTLMELEMADTLRITTNAAGAQVDFTIYSIEITTENWMPFVF